MYRKKRGTGRGRKEVQEAKRGLTRRRGRQISEVDTQQEEEEEEEEEERARTEGKV